MRSIEKKFAKLLGEIIGKRWVKQQLEKQKQRNGQARGGGYAKREKAE